MKKGFTLLEVLVASLLMGMLVTILTMIFNQSSIAWRTGRASISDLSEITQVDSVCQYVADNAIPFLGDDYCVVSPWDDANYSGDPQDAGHVYKRGIQKVSDLKNDGRLPNLALFEFRNDKIEGLKDRLGNSSADNGKNYIVGVESSGPDRKWDTEDDISTWPDGID